MWLLFSAATPSLSTSAREQISQTAFICSAWSKLEPMRKIGSSQGTQASLTPNILFRGILFLSFLLVNPVTTHTFIPYFSAARMKFPLEKSPPPLPDPSPFFCPLSLLFIPWHVPLAPLFLPPSSSCASLPPKRKVCKHFFTCAHWFCWWKWGEKKMGTQSHLGHLTFLMWTWSGMDASSLPMMMWLASLSSYFFWGQMKFTLAPCRRWGIQSSRPGGWSCLTGRGLGHTSFHVLAWLAPEAVMPQPGWTQTGV